MGRFVLAALLAVLSLADPAGVGASQESLLAEGKADFDFHCVACHGPEGRGDGPMAGILIVPPSDLTLIAERHDGRYPFWRIYAIISGDVQVKGHDTFQMPQYWDRFRGDETKSGYPPASIRILLLTHFLESLQGPPR